MILADVSIGFCVVIDDSNVSGCRVRVCMSVSIEKKVPNSAVKAKY